MKKLTYISVPLWQGAEKEGVELAPKSFIDAGADTILRQYYEVEHVSLPPISQELHGDNKYAVMAQYVTHLKQVVANCLTMGSFPFVVGGDHTIGLGSVAASVEKYDNLGIIWFDAHGDMNTEATSQTGHMHGMPLAALMGFCTSELNKVTTRYIKPENIFWVGTRSLDPGEKELIEKLHLHIYSAAYVKSFGMRNVMKQIQMELQRLHITHLHCSMDVDAMDPRIVPATGVTEPNGLDIEEYISFVSELAHLPIQLTSLDCVEYNPLLDDNKKHTLQICLKAIDTLFRKLNQA